MLVSLFALAPACGASLRPSGAEGGGQGGEDGTGGAPAADAAPRPDAGSGTGGTGFVQDAAVAADAAEAIDVGQTADSARPDARPIGDAPPPIDDAPACKRKVPVSSLAALQGAIAGAMPGDCVVVAAGRYTTTAPITIDRAGTAAARITVMAETIGGVTIDGAAGFAVNAPAAHVTIRGFHFLHAGGMKVATGTTSCLVTRNAFELPGGASFLTVAGTDNEVSFNSFQNKSTAGAFLILDEDAITLRPYAHHNHFRNHTYPGSNGGEAIRVFATLPRVEHNLFEEIHVAGEIVSVKEGGSSMGGFYRFNTFRDCTRGFLTLRFARRDVVEGNFFFASPGIRVYGRDHRIINNYLEGGTIRLGDGAAGAYPGIDNVDVAFNTLVGARIDSEDRGDAGVPPQNLRIANNIIQAEGGLAVQERHPFVNVTYAGNILWGSAAPGSVPPTGFHRADPQLDGYHLRPGSPAINAASASVMLPDDIEGQPRTMADVGADELSTGPAARGPLTANDVGPNGR